MHTSFMESHFILNDLKGGDAYGIFLFHRTYDKHNEVVAVDL